VKTLERLALALLEKREELLSRWRLRVRELPSARSLDMPTLNDHVPVWISELAARLRARAPETAVQEAEAAEMPVAHGLQRVEDGFDIEEVVAEYNILRDCVHDLAESHGVELRAESRRALNDAFDDAIGGAVKAFAAGQAREVQRRRAEHLAFVAHDLRTPLAAITFSAHMLEQRLAPEAGSETLRLVKVLGRNARQLDTLVGQVLKENTQLLTELGVKVERRAFDLWPFVENLAQDLKPLADKAGARIVNQVPDDLAVRADAGLLRRVFQNLVANAITYAPGGEVSIGARDGDVVECWVADTGRGIPRDRIGKVFEALETDPAGDGLGLGLAIVKTFVEAHDGTVSVESVEGEGATFRFTLPREVAAPAADEGQVGGVEGAPSVPNSTGALT